MSKDIRSFFQPKSSKNNVEIPKRRAQVLESDDDEIEIVEATPKDRKKKERIKVKKRRIIESDDDEDERIVKSPVRNKRPNLSKLIEELAPKYEKPSAEEIEAKFGHVPKRVEKKKTPSTKKSENGLSNDDIIMLIDDDDDFNESIINLNESELITESKTNGNAITSNLFKNKSPKKSPLKNATNKTPTKNNSDKSNKFKKLNIEEKSKDDISREDKKKTPIKEDEKYKTNKTTNIKEEKPETPKKKIEISKTPNKNSKIEIESESRINKVNESNNKVNKSVANISFESGPTRTPKVKKADLDSSVLTDEDRHERKRMSAILYQKYKNRQGVINPGSKEIPKGKPNCLAGLSFLVTGVLESMERDEANQVIKDFGGKVAKSIIKRLDYMVVGEEAGPKKIATAEELGIKMISEDGLFDLIRAKSGETMKNINKQAISPKKEKKIKEETREEKKIKEETREEKKTKKESPEVKPKHEKSDENNKEHKEKTPKKRKLNDENDVTVKKEKIESSKDTIKNEVFAKTSNKSAETSEKTPKKRKPNDENDCKIEKEKIVSSKDTIKNEVPSKTSNKTAEIVNNNDILAWVDRYKPINLKQIIGQQGAASNVVKLQKWLSKWYISHDGKKKLQKPNPWAKNDDGSFFKAALLSGPPGVGKTTTAHLVCRELGFDIVEFNASDTRSKRLLKEEVTELLSNKSLYGYFNGKSETVSKKHVLIMDEVDGMAGNEDRGGVAELIALIKDSSIPVICMCNDRNHQKMRSLVNYCFDLRFNKPRLEQIRGPIMSICFKENFKLPTEKIDEIITATNNDIRQTINHLSLLAAGDDTKIEFKEKDKIAKKDLKLGPWDVVRKVFTIEDQQNMTIHDRSDLFFNDYSLGPLFVQQNYLQVLPVGPKDTVPEKIALTADALSLGDLIDRRIRSNSAWTLLPTQAMFSSVMPGEYMSGHFVGQINFPGWLGKYSKANKRKRLAQELHDHTRIRTSGSRLSIRQDYAPFLLNAIVRPLKEKGSDGVEEALEIMKEYRLLREDIESLIELSTWPGRKSPMDSVDGKVKAALTRAYNKEVLAYSYSAMAGVKKKKAEKADDVNELDGEGDGEVIVESENEEDDNIENDALIKAKKKTTVKTNSGKDKKEDSKKSTNKGKGKK